MINFISDLPENIVGVKVSGDVTKKEYEDDFTPEIEKRLSGKKEIIYLVLLTANLSNIEIGVWWDDFKLAVEHIGHWKKVAIISNQKMINKLVNIMGFILPGKHKGFSLDDYDEAVTWLNQ